MTSEPLSEKVRFNLTEKHKEGDKRGKEHLKGSFFGGGRVINELQLLLKCYTSLCPFSQNTNVNHYTSVIYLTEYRNCRYSENLPCAVSFMCDLRAPSLPLTPEDMKELTFKVHT